MRIIDENGVEIEKPDLEKGYLVTSKVFVKHHEATAGKAEKGHYETIKEYPSGGKEVEWVVDEPAVAPTEAWDEYEDVKVYKLYTEEELKKREDSAKSVEKLTQELTEVKASSTVTEEALLELTESYNQKTEQLSDNEKALVDLTEYVSTLEERIAELESKLAKGE